MQYAPFATPEFNGRLHESLMLLARDVRGAVGDNLLALVLGGGYGRGEGAVVRRDGRERPYNDLDLALVVRAPRLAADPLDAVRAHYEAELGIQVDFSRPLTVRDIRRWPSCLMWQDFLNGHVTLEGPPDVLSRNAPSRLREPLPAIEATRLLLNRGAGLLWAWRVVREFEEAPDDDFVRRNYHKCALALGDALLIAYGRFTTRYQGRECRLRWLERERLAVARLDLGSLYQQALAFKFAPDEFPPQPPHRGEMRELERRWSDVLLHVESLRTGRAWDSAEDYAAWTGLREPEQHRLSRLPRNLARNLQSGVLSTRYPREALYRELPRLLGVARGPHGGAWNDASAAFLEIWKRCN